MTVALGSLGIDFGSYTPNVTAERIDQARDLGISWVTVGVTGNPYFDQQMQAAAALNRDVYLIPRSWAEDGAQAALRALQAIAPYAPVLWVWLDVETLGDQPAPSPSQVWRWLRGALDVLDKAHQPAGIYTSASQWGQLTGNTGAFGDRPLWEAHYAPEAPAFVPFGGWTRRAGVQFQGSTTIAEMNVDLNLWEDKAMLTDEEIKGLIGALLGKAVATDSDLAALRREILVQGHLLATGRAADADARIKYEAAAAGIALP